MYANLQVVVNNGNSLYAWRVEKDEFGGLTIYTDLNDDGGSHVVEGPVIVAGPTDHVVITADF